jgi:hypothetical protein
LVFRGSSFQRASRGDQRKRTPASGAAEAVPFQNMAVQNMAIQNMVQNIAIQNMAAHWQNLPGSRGAH